MSVGLDYQAGENSSSRGLQEEVSPEWGPVSSDLFNVRQHLLLNAVGIEDEICSKLR